MLTASTRIDKYPPPPCPAFGQRFSDKFPTAGIDIPPRGGGALLELTGP